MRVQLWIASPKACRALTLAWEDLGEGWQVSCAPPCLPDAELWVLERAAQLTQWMQTPPVPAPFTLLLGEASPLADCCLPQDTPLQALTEAVLAFAATPALPKLSSAALPRLEMYVRRMLTEMGLKPRLRAAAYLPEMIACCAAHPPLLADVSHRLYPLIAQRYQMRPAAVERSLRSAMDSLWRCGCLSALDKWFGHTVDPEKGRPTNREFLALMAEHAKEWYWEESSGWHSL